MTEKKLQEPLMVSVIILTYNSGKFIKETLESARTQSYKNIELIISDDASKDNTIKVCEYWLKQNKKRFVSTKILKVDKNTGIAANYNRGLKTARGEWVKFCSGDDALLPNCIEDNLDHVALNPEVKVLFSYCRMYEEVFIEKGFKGLNPGGFPSNIIGEDISVQDQYKLLLVKNRIPFTPSAFIHLETHIKYSILNEKLPFSEDYQNWLNFTKNGVKLHFMEKETMKYRIHLNSLSNQEKNVIINPIYFKTADNMKALSYPYLPWDIKFSKMHTWYVNQIFRINILNKKNKFNATLHYVLNTVLNPFRYVIYIKMHYLKKYKNDLFYK